MTKKQLLTQKQLDTFNKHFEVVETTRDVSTYVANLDLDEVNKYEPGDNFDNFFIVTNWSQKSSEAISSDGYEIIRKQNDKTVKEVFDVPDVVEFILHEMDKYIQ